jgi:hypothetical protein
VRCCIKVKNNLKNSKHCEKVEASPADNFCFWFFWIFLKNMFYIKNIILIFFNNFNMILKIKIKKIILKIILVAKFQPYT